MRLVLASLAGAVLIASTAYITCGDDYHHHNNVRIEDVTVEITGTTGAGFTADFEDNNHDQSVTGAVPYSAEFQNQECFFDADLTKTSSGTDQVCLRVSTSDDDRQTCTTAPNGHIHIKITF